MPPRRPGNTPHRGPDLLQRGVSTYVQLAALFRQRIETGAWAQSQRIPTVAELAMECGAARETIRQALGLLEQEGLIRRFRAKGTFVTGEARDSLWCELHTDFFGLLQARDGAVIEVLSEARHEQPSGEIGFGILAPAYRRLRRRHWRSGEPYLYANLWIDERLIDRIPRAAFTRKTALKMVADIPGISLADVQQIMTIGAADLEVAEALRLPLNAPVAKVDRYAVDGDGALVLLARGVYRGDVVRLSIKSK